MARLHVHGDEVARFVKANSSRVYSLRANGKLLVRKANGWKISNLQGDREFVTKLLEDNGYMEVVK